MKISYEGGRSLVGRAPALHAGGRRFESDRLHQEVERGLIAQLVRARA